MVADTCMGRLYLARRRSVDGRLREVALTARCRLDSSNSTVRANFPRFISRELRVGFRGVLCVACYISLGPLPETHTQFRSYMSRVGTDALKTPVVGQEDPPWASWPDEALLDLPMCDLHLDITGGFLEQPIAELYRELEARQLLFRPHFWISNEWFTPDGIPGIAVPCYLAHPRLAKLELAQMLEVEGGTADWCLRILRHEAGHAIENAFKIRRRK